MTSPRLAETLSEAPFIDRKESIDRFVSVLSEEIERRNPDRLLDLGCGTGAACFAIADRFPGLDITGIDISDWNIKEANRYLADTEHGDRMRFETADFMAWKGGKHDLIATDGVLHLIECDDGQLVEKLSENLSRSGSLLITMPVAGLHNSLLSAARALWRMTPQRLDDFALFFARMLHPKEETAVLRDRVHYLRVLPVRQFNSEFESELSNAGLKVKELRDWPAPSILKLRHGLISIERGR